MKPAYLSYLACPKCSGDLEILEPAGAAEDLSIETGALRCTGCGATSPIRHRIPRFVDSTPYADSFGLQWLEFAKTQIDTEETNESEVRFRTETGWSAESLKGCVVIEMGSGAGRFVDVVSKSGAKLAIGLDVTDAVDAAQSNLGDRDNVLFIQGDIFAPPVKKEVCDVGYSIGVLHHTPDPQQGFKNMYDLVKPEGRFGVSLYEILLQRRPNRDNPVVSGKDVLWALNIFRSEVFRAITSRLPDRLFLAYCKTVVPILHHINKIPVIRYVRYLLPSTCYRNLPVSWSVLDTFDTYATSIVHRYRGKDVFRWFTALGARDAILHNGRDGWVSVTGVKTSCEEREQRTISQERPAGPGYL